MNRVLVPRTLSPVLPPPGSVGRTLAGRSMGTTWSARVVMEGDAAPPAVALQGALDEVVAQMSHWEEQADLMRYNRAAPGVWQRLPDAFYQVLRYALTVAEDTGGAYDPCAGALVERWGFGARGRYDESGFVPPGAAEIAALLAAPRWRGVRLDHDGRRVLQPGGVHLDLSSVAKGFAVDQLARVLERCGLHHYRVEAGGELRGAGVKPDGAPWWVGLEDVPGAEPAIVPTVAALHGLALATSGDYRRHYSNGSTRASHTVDPRSGNTIVHQLASVSVLHASCMAADALSTALTVLGPDAGLRHAEQHGLAARFLVRDGTGLREICSSAYTALLQ